MAFARRELNMHLGGNYLHETPIVTAARKPHGGTEWDGDEISAALIGKLGPVAIFDGAKTATRGMHNIRAPSINGPTSLAAIRTVDSALGALEQSLKSLGLFDSTAIIVAADHGFSTIDKGSRTSLAARAAYSDTRADELPPGFLAMDLAAALHENNPALRLFDPDQWSVCE
jgi:hypothetical protein